MLSLPHTTAPRGSPLHDMVSRDELVAENDGLPMAGVGPWAEDKYRLLALYDRLFSTGMKFKWDLRIYVDLYAGGGLSRVQGTNKILTGSPIIALGVADPFDHYVFCEQNDNLLRALKARVSRLFPQARASFLLGDCNDRVDEILALIPASSPTQKVLSLCFADPHSLSIKFSTVKKLAKHRMDFLFLLALWMDANRNEEHYLNPKNPKIDEFLESSDWRARWTAQKEERIRFPQFLAEEFSRGMVSLGYLHQPFYRMKLVRSEMNLPLYHLALFSRSDRAYDFWEKVLKLSTDQGSLDFE